ncbi:uncharacterized protein LOC120358930 [Solenopsis invicta]|uniref:uncharacterized protein LOC120358930 n=1 Tax=Solenopsis invicta TaxID=13686 RepID=UPI00193EA4CB|nr:uncharacterized protein LOC120358930 [Solenopsis invicta]
MTLSIPYCFLVAIPFRVSLLFTNIRDTSTQALKQHCLLSPKMASTLMGNLPKHRITVPKRPFFICGIDYAGPFYIKEGTRKNAKLVKCYMAIFVCFATTAVHIELATDLSTAAFLNVLKRFISRRGHPSDIYSDNGLNFKGACRELTELATVFNDQQNQQQIIGYVSAKGINWHFTPPRAPHQGGLWEAAVKSAKRHLLCITKETNLKYEELETLLVQVEAILNSRPLTPLSSDSHDLTPLTPGHFLIGSPLTSYPEPSLERLPENPVHVGQIVLLQEDSTLPLTWPLARIQAVHPGDDGIIRTVTLRTAKGTYKRSITRLCLLPSEDH